MIINKQKTFDQSESLIDYETVSVIYDDISTLTNNINKEITTLTNNINKEITNINNYFKSLNSKIENLNSELIGIKLDIEKIKQLGFESLNSEIENLNSELIGIKLDIAKTKNKQPTKKKKLTILEEMELERNKNE